jgi:hypothetical protein
MNDSRQRNSQGQFAPEQQGGVDANTTSAAYNPQIIEARKASLAEKLRRAIGLRRGVEESVPEDRTMLSAKLRLRELARVAAQPYPEEERKGGIGKLGALGLGLGLGIGGGVAGVKYLRPVVSKAVNRAARNVTKGTQDVVDAAKTAIPEAAAAVKQTAADAQDAMAIGKDIGKTYQKAKPQVQRGFWNVTNPRKFAKEIYGEFKAGMKEGEAVKAAMANAPKNPKTRSEWRKRLVQGSWWRGERRIKGDQIKNPYKANRPAWADGETMFERLQDLVEFSNRLIAFEEERSSAGILGGLTAAGVGALALPTALPALRNLRRLKKTTGAKGMEDRAGFVADYLRMASRAGRTPGLEQFVGGFKGQWTTRRALQGRGRFPFQKLSPDQASGAHFSGNHNQKFTMGPKMAHDHWDWEVMSRFEGKKAGRDRAAFAQAAKKRGIDPKTFKPDGMTSMYGDVPVSRNTLHDKILAGKKAAHKHIGDRISKGDTYEDAVASLRGRSSNVDEYLGALMRDKAQVAQGYGKAAMASPALLVGGVGVAGASAHRKEKK